MFRVFLAVVVLLCPPAWLQAQAPTKIQGVIEGVMRGGMIVTNKADTFPWRIVVAPNTQILVTGTATGSYLRPGQWVEFEVELDDQGAIKDKIDELTIITRSADKPIGVFPADAATDDGQGGFGANQGDGFGGIDWGENEKPAKKSRKPGRSIAKGALTAGAYRVVGQLAGGRDGKFSVRAGRRPLPFELAEQATIKVALNDFSVVARGDKVSIRGMKAPGQTRAALAVELTIELAEPLVGKKKRVPAKPKAKRGAKKPAGLPEPADDQ